MPDHCCNLTSEQEGAEAVCSSGASLSETAFGADLGGSSKYSN